MRVLPKDQWHVSGDGNDGATTIAQKARAMVNAINLQHASSSILRHNRAQTIARWVIGAICVGIIILAVRWVSAVAWIERTI
jgi:CHASE3 domain sensor protein